MLQEAFMCFAHHQSYAYICMLTCQIVTIYENINVVFVLAIVIVSWRYVNNIIFRRASEMIFVRFSRSRWSRREGQNFHCWDLKTVLEPSWLLGPPRDISIRMTQLCIEALKEWRPPFLFCFKTMLKAKQGLICDVFVCV